MKMQKYEHKMTGKEVFQLMQGAVDQGQFGRPNRPPTPIKDVVNNEFGLAAQQLRSEQEQEYAKVSLTFQPHDSFNIAITIEQIDGKTQTD